VENIKVTSGRSPAGAIPRNRRDARARYMSRRCAASSSSVSSWREPAAAAPGAVVWSRPVLADPDPVADPGHRGRHGDDAGAPARPADPVLRSRADASPAPHKRDLPAVGDWVRSYHKLAGEHRAAVSRQGLAHKLAETRRARAKKPPPPGDD